MAERNTNYLLHRDEVLERYGGKCANCGSSDDLEIHHIVPVALGGTDNVTNLIPLCHACHQVAHHGRDLNEVKKQRGTARRGGRDPKISFEEFDDAFGKYIGGCIGKKAFCNMVGYGLHISKGSNPHYAKSMDIRGVKKFRNNIDTLGINGSRLVDGVIVGYVEYVDGRKEDMIYHEIGENNVEYAIRKLNPRKDRAIINAGAADFAEYVKIVSKTNRRNMIRLSTF